MKYFSEPIRGRVLRRWSRSSIICGLRASIKIRRNPEGDQVLDDCADGLLGASIGMAVDPTTGQTIDGTRRRIHKAYLDHVALTATPAYAGAEVLEVRTAPVVELALAAGATPLLDRALAIMQRSLVT